MEYFDKRSRDLLFDVYLPLSAGATSTTTAEATQTQNLGKTQSLLVELNKNSGRDPGYTCTKTGADLLNEIKFYRAVELWGEGFDWFDMKRWGDPIDRHTYEDGGNFLAALAVKIQPQEKNKWTWKIPVKETDYNHDVLPQ